MTRQQKIDIITSDFLSRNGKNYTSQKSTGRLGWEALLESGSAYSSAMLSPKDEADLLRTAYGHARDMVIAMNTPFKVKIALTPDSSYTDGKTLAVATDMFDDTALSVGQKIDVFTGLAIHEGSHLLYTDFALLPKAENRITADLLNIIEDERIEMRTGQDRPGLANFLACAKYYYFDRHSSRMRSSSKPLDRPTRLLNAILSMIRYPKTLEADDVKEFADTLFEVRNVIFPYPDTCQESLDAARKIYAIIRRFFKQEKKKRERQSGSGKGPDGKASGKDGSPRTSDKDIEDSLKDALESIERDVTQRPSDGSDSGSLDMRRMSRSVLKDGCRLGKAVSGEIEIGRNAKVNIHTPKSNRELYMQSLERVRRHIPAMATALRGNGSDRTSELRGLRSGSLDTCRIAEAVQGVESIYRQQSVVKADRIAVCILVDESGSMEGEKITAARDAAVLLNEALASVRNVDLYIYGHTTEAGAFVKLNAYREGKAAKEKHSLGSIEADRGNIDSKAIREAASRVRARTRERCLFFVISDGAPCENTDNVRKAVTELSRDGFSFVSIGIDFEYDPSTMYDHHVSLTDMSRLAPELGKMIKKAIMDNSKMK